MKQTTEEQLRQRIAELERNGGHGDILKALGRCDRCEFEYQRGDRYAAITIDCEGFTVRRGEHSLDVGMQHDPVRDHDDLPGAVELLRIWLEPRPC